MRISWPYYKYVLVSLVSLSAMLAPAATIAPPKKTHTKSRHVTENAATQKKLARMKHSSRTTASVNQSSHVVVAKTRKPLYKRTKYYERFYASSSPPTKSMVTSPLEKIL